MDLLAWLVRLVIGFFLCLVQSKGEDVNADGKFRGPQGQDEGPGTVALDELEEGLDHDDEPDIAAIEEERRCRREKRRRKKTRQGGQVRTRPYLHRAGKERPVCVPVPPGRTRPYLPRAAKSRPAG